jgi:putative methyltransferase (TIGR04325 family)
MSSLKSLPVIAPLAAAAYRYAFFRRNRGRFFGVFDSAEAARRAAERTRTSYDDPSIVDINLRSFLALHLFDWPVLHHLYRAVRESGVQSLVDFGGHVGVKYYAMREHLPLEPAFRWQVVEVPAMVAEGRRRQAELGIEQLAFHETIEQAGPAQLLLCSGALQYCGVGLAELIGRMRERPSVVIVNKLPVSDRGGFFTLESFGDPKLPYHVLDRADHRRSMEQAGFHLASEWRLPERDFSVPYSSPTRSAQLLGEVWHAKT